MYPSPPEMYHKKYGAGRDFLNNIMNPSDFEQVVETHDVQLLWDLFVNNPALLYMAACIRSCILQVLILK